MKMKRKTIVLLTIAVLILVGLSAWFWRHANRAPFIRRGVAHQLPYKWDSYVRPDVQFTSEPMTSVIAKVNAVIRDVSSNVVPEAIKLDTTPTQIVKGEADPSLDRHMDQLIAAFRENEREMNRRGAEGFEGTLFTGDLDGHHSLWCTLVGPGNGGLNWEAKEDALHASRMPRVMECRAYAVTGALNELMEANRRANYLHVGCEPHVSALIDATGIHSWSIMVPDGPNSWKGEFRYEQVLRYVPEAGVILALATPEEHAKAQERLRNPASWNRKSVEGGARKQEDTTNGSTVRATARP